MIKLKTILSEGFAWEREEGKPLPTLAETTAAYEAKMRKESRDHEPEDRDPRDFDDQKRADRAEAEYYAGLEPDDDIDYDDENFSDPMIDLEESEDNRNESMKKVPIFQLAEGKVVPTNPAVEALKLRMIGNLKGSEYILSQTFKKKVN